MTEKVTKFDQLGLYGDTQVVATSPSTSQDIPSDIDPLTIAYLTLYSSIIADGQKQNTNMNSIQACIKATKESNARLEKMNFEVMGSMEDVARGLSFKDIDGWDLYKLAIELNKLDPQGIETWIAGEKAKSKTDEQIKADFMVWGNARMKELVYDTSYNLYMDDAQAQFQLDFSSMETRNQQVVKERDMETNNITVNQQWEQVAMTDSQTTSNSTSQKLSMASAFADILRSVSDKIAFPV